MKIGEALCTAALVFAGIAFFMMMNSCNKYNELEQAKQARANVRCTEKCKPRPMKWATETSCACDVSVDVIGNQ